MAGLVGYASSDDEDESQERVISPVEPPRTLGETNAATNNHTQDSPGTSHKKVDTGTNQNQPLIGPSLGPSLPPASQPLPQYAPQPELDSGTGPSSPHTANRALLQDLTLPSVPDLDIPPSPPGSPPAALSKKLEQFLALKAKGVHLNSKLESSHGLKNPGAMDKLLGFVGISGAGEYETVLGADLHDPASFPPEKYRSALKKEHERRTKEREAEKLSAARSSIDFVPPAASGR